MMGGSEQHWKALCPSMSMKMCDRVQYPLCPPIWWCKPASEKSSIVFHNQHHAKMPTNWQKVWVLDLVLPTAGENPRSLKHSSNVCFPGRTNQNTIFQWVQWKQVGRRGPRRIFVCKISSNAKIIMIKWYVMESLFFFFSNHC